MKLTKLIIGIICIITLFLFSYLGTAHTADTTQSHTESLENNQAVYNIRIFDSFIDPGTINVKKSSSVELFITYSGSETNRFIIEGYDIEERLFDGKTISLRFKADKEGSFEIGSFKRPLGMLVVG
ncbi:hypothetical protein CMO89_00275 [Candidatus Woesearchaeota archaeon]|nr:hypothetical protein [Candidatus Woesearchaeota archaeon]